MKTKIFFSVPALALMISAFGQRPTLELIFTAIDNASYVQLDSIKVMNRTQGGDTVLYWPDTILVLDYQAGITEINNEEKNLRVFQNYPNPVINHTTLTLYLPEKGEVNLVITDILGHQVINTGRMLDKGYHSFRFTPGSGEIFFFTAYWKATCSTIKILVPGNGSALTNSLEYTGSKITGSLFKRIEATQNFSFSPGDELLYIGYTNTLQSGMLDVPGANEAFSFQFAINIPCPGTPTVTYEGQVYNTIQIFSQCWLKENLNAGIMINGNQNQQNNGTIEKYCYDNDPANCDGFGGMYQWNEMMQYTTTQGVQGICPPTDGWHIPTDEEWKILEGTVDSQYGVGDPEWDEIYWRGFDAAYHLKSIAGWSFNGNGDDSFSFSALPGGFRYYDNFFYNLDYYAYFWSSTEESSSYAWFRRIFHSNDRMSNYFDYKTTGFSVRCVRD